MKTLVVYDSVYGNTEKIAQAIGGAVTGDVRILRVAEVKPSDWESLDWLIVGSPTYGGRPTQPIQDFLGSLAESIAKGLKVTAFDTRLTTRLVAVFGYAAPRIAAALEAKGARLAESPQGFFVKGREGPLKEGEVERAADWARGALK
jgi:flavodoxin I